MAEHVECPECSKKAVVHRNDNLYQCLNCDFQRDFSEPPQSKPENPFFWPSVIVTIVSLLLLQAKQATVKTPSLESQSSPAPLVVQSKTN